MKVKIKKLHPDAKIPFYAYENDAGLDLTCISRVYNEQKNYWIFGTGLAIEIPKNHLGLIFPRSSIRNTSYRLSNSIGLLDHGYLGEIIITLKKDWFYYHEGNNYQISDYKIGDRIAQLVILPYPKIELEEVEELSKTERNEKGFGSTGT
jgi:dUTP pyrophosphatase